MLCESLVCNKALARERVPGFGVLKILNTFSHFLADRPLSASMRGHGQEISLVIEFGLDVMT